MLVDHRHCDALVVRRWHRRHCHGRGEGAGSRGRRRRESIRAVHLRYREIVTVDHGQKEVKLFTVEKLDCEQFDGQFDGTK